MLTRKHQLYATTEQVEGAFASPTSSGLRLAYDLQVTPEFVEHERNLVGESGSRHASEIGRESLKMSFGIDLKSGGATGSVPNEPLWAMFLKTCGMRPTRLREVAIGAVTGTFVHGESFTAATSNATGIIVGSYSGAGHTELIYYPTNGKAVVTADALTGGSSGATVTTSGTPTDQGYVYTPTLDIVWSVGRTAAWSGRIPDVGETFVGGTSGARAKILKVVDEGTSGTVYFEPIFGTFTGSETITTDLTPATSTTLSATIAAPSGNSTLSMLSNLDGIDFRARGCRGNWKLPLKSGEPARWQFEFSGLAEMIADAAPTTANSPDSTRGLRFQSANFSVDSLAMKIAQFDLDGGMSLNLRDDPSAAFGALSYRITDRDPGGSMDPELNALASYDFFAKWRKSTGAFIKTRLGTPENQLGTGTHDVGGTIWIDVPSAQYVGTPTGDRDGIVTAQAAFKARRLDWYGQDEVRVFVL